jgi:hypothetical protein
MRVHFGIDVATLRWRNILGDAYPLAANEVSAAQEFFSQTFCLPICGIAATLYFVTCLT